MALSLKNLSTNSKIIIAISAGALVLGVSVGYSAAGSAAKQVAASAAEPVTVTKTEQVVKSVVPDSCTAAMDSADELNALVELTFTDLSGGITAIAAGDYDESDRLTAKITNRTGQVQSSKLSYTRYAAACRSEASQ